MDNQENLSVVLITPSDRFFLAANAPSNLGTPVPGARGLRGERRPGRRKQKHELKNNQSPPQKLKNHKWSWGEEAEHPCEVVSCATRHKRRFWTGSVEDGFGGS